MKYYFDLICRVLGIVALLLFFMTTAALYFAGHWMQVHDKLEKADYILPLAGEANRLYYAAELYEQGYAPQILVSINALPPHTPADEVNAKMGYPQLSPLKYAQRFYAILGVPQDALQAFGHGHLSTIEEIEALRAFLEKQTSTQNKTQKTSILVITSPYHARRAKLILDSLLPNTQTFVTVTPHEHFNSNWWQDYYTAPKIVLEAAKCLYWLVGGVFRSTDSCPS